MSLMQDKNLLVELTLFYKDLELYQSNRVSDWKKQLTESQKVSMEDLRDKLVRKSGKFKSIITELSDRQYLTKAQGGQEQDFDMWVLGLDLFFDSASNVKAINCCIDATNQAIGKLESDIEEGVRDKQGKIINKPAIVETTPPIAFIAHGGKTAARDKLKDFLMALGVTPIIVEDQPSQGRSKEQNVEYYLKQCDCAIILSTKGDIDGQTSEFIPRGNILNELGRCQETLPHRMIYLLEEETKFPTNIDEKVWERFTQESMDKAFTKIAKELRAFGLLKAMKG